MAKRGWAARAMAALRRATDLLQQAAKSVSSSSTAPHIVSPSASLAFAVTITAVAGIVIAAALGGTLFFSLSRRKQKSPLTPKQWYAAFDSVSGRLINHHKVLERIRFGGIDPSIRADVWPFLLGFYELDSTREEQESAKRRKRELYIALKLRCNILRDSIHGATLEYENSSDSTKVSSDGLSSSSPEQENAATFESENKDGSRELSSDHQSSPSEEQKSAATFECENKNGIREVSSDGQSSPSEEQKNAALFESENKNESREVSSGDVSSPSEDQKTAATFECEVKNEGREVSSECISFLSEEQKNAATFDCENKHKSGEVSSDSKSSPSEEQKNVAIYESENKKGSREVSSDGQSSPSEEQKNAAAFECENKHESREVGSDGLSSSSEEQKNGAGASDDSPSNDSIEDTEDNPEKLPKVGEGPPVEKDREVTSALDGALTPCTSNEEDVKDEELLQTKNDSADADLKTDSLEATDNFINCQRIIRLDAVRMNAEWVPYSPSQANVTKELALELAKNVALKDDEHLEPCRQHHAARLVAILEAYALYDPETGYCQGMSDLLSPFVALLDEDYEAFWCFVQFMSTARYNFRSDETGIRRQLNKISSIFKAADPRLYSHFESIDADNCFFVYRMVVVLLRRELTFEQTISLWEVIWAENRALIVSHARTGGEKITRKTLLIEDLILYVIAAAVRQKRKVILEQCRGLDELLRECNSMAGHLDVWKLLDDAREMAYVVCRQL